MAQLDLANDLSDHFAIDCVGINGGIWQPDGASKRHAHVGR